MPSLFGLDCFRQFLLLFHKAFGIEYHAKSKSLLQSVADLKTAPVLIRK